MARPKANKERAVGISTSDERSVSTARLAREKDGSVVGVFSTPGSRPYGASSAIERGTADKLRFEDKIRQLAAGTCICGCGQQPSNPESLFMPGHDSKVRAMGLAVQRGEIKLSAIPKLAKVYIEEGKMFDRHGPSKVNRTQVEGEAR